MLIFHGRVNTLGSSMVASYEMASRLMNVNRSTSFRASLWKFPDLSNQVWSVKSVVSTTRVSPSQRPSEWPMYAVLGYGATLSRWIVREASANWKIIMILVVPWAIWNGDGRYIARGTPGRKHL